MNLFTTDKVCDIDSETCDWVYDQTGNEALGVAAELTNDAAGRLRVLLARG